MKEVERKFAVQSQIYASILFINAIAVPIVVVQLYNPLARTLQILKPNPAIHVLYRSTVDWQSFRGSGAFENSMHSSRLAFSSLHTQQGFGLAAASELWAEAWTAEAVCPNEGIDAAGDDIAKGSMRNF